MEKRVIEGRWWLAGTDKEVAGSLIGDEKGWNLELNGVFAEQTDDEIRKVLSGHKSGFISPHPEQTILGITKDGKPITLEYFTTKGTHIFLTGYGYNSESYPVHKFFENVHFSDPREVKFKKILVSMPYLFDWLGEHLVEVEREYDPTGTKEIEARFKCKPGTTIPIGTLGNIRVALRTYVNIPFFPSKSIAIQQDTELVLESVSIEEVSLQDFRTAIFAFRDLVAIAVGLDIPIQSVVAFTDANKEIFPNGNTFNPEVIVYDNFIQTDVVPVKHMRKELMNFTFADITTNAETVMQNWFNKSQDRKDVFNLYFTTLATPNLNLRNKFLSILSAIEGYARYDISLRDAKLKSVLISMHDSIKKYGRLFATDGFEIIISTRDKFTHIELTDSTRKTLDDHELYGVIRKLSAMLEMAMLLDLGLEEESLERIAKKKISSAKR